MIQKGIIAIATSGEMAITPNHSSTLSFLVTVHLFLFKDKITVQAIQISTTTKDNITPKMPL